MERAKQSHQFHRTNLISNSVAVQQNSNTGCNFRLTLKRFRILSSGQTCLQHRFCSFAWRSNGSCSNKHRPLYLCGFLSSCILPSTSPNHPFFVFGGSGPRPLLATRETWKSMPMQLMPTRALLGATQRDGLFALLPMCVFKPYVRSNRDRAQHRWVFQGLGIEASPWQQSSAEPW